MAAAETDGTEDGINDLLETDAGVISPSIEGYGEGGSEYAGHSELKEAAGGFPSAFDEDLYSDAEGISAASSSSSGSGSGCGSGSCGSGCGSDNADTELGDEF